MFIKRSNYYKIDSANGEFEILYLSRPVKCGETAIAFAIVQIYVGSQNTNETKTLK
jgi:hypothetical protein